MRRLLLPLALAMSLCAPGASSALAAAPEGAQKAPFFGPSPGGFCGAGVAQTPETFGFAVLNTPRNERTLTGKVALRHAAPKTTYRVEVGQAISAFSCSTTESGTITTNEKGNGNLHFRVKRVPGTTEFFVELVFGFPEPPIFATRAVELD